MKKIIRMLAITFFTNINAQIITTVAGNGIGSYSGDGGQATAANLNTPSGVAFDAAGNLYIADVNNNRIRKVTTAGAISTVAGNGTGGYSGDGGQATNAELNSPRGVACDATGNLYIADFENNRIRKVTTAGVISTVAGNGTGGYSGDGGQATVAELNQPIGVTLDTAGNLYIADTYNNRIRIVTTAGVISTVAGNGTGGYSGDGGQATATELYTPAGITFDAAGNLYIGDVENNRIRKVTTVGVISTVTGNGIPGTTGVELYFPDGVAVDDAGNLYIADTYNNRIQKVTSAGVISTVAGNGTGGYSGDGGQATTAELNDPSGVTFDAAGNLYIADQGNNRIRRVTIPLTVNSSTVCASNTTALTASGTATYSWSPSSGLSATTGASVIANPTVTTTYTVTGTTYGSTRTATITVYALGVTINTATICMGSTATLTANGATTYTWSNSATTASISVSPTVTSDYTVTATGGINNCTDVFTTTVTVNPIPIITINPPIDTICAGVTTTLTASGALTYTWSNTYTSNTSTGATIYPSPVNTANYIVTGIDVNGCKNTVASTIIVNTTNFSVAFSATQQLLTAPPFIVQFTNSTPSPSNYTFTWLFGDGQSQQTNNASVFHTYSYNGNYDVTLIAISNSTGCTDTLFKGGYIFCTGGAVAGINQVTGINNQVNIYPNPNNGAFIIETNSPEKQTLHIYDVNGKLVLIQSINGRTDIDASSLNEGVYNISIISNEGVVNRRLIIVK